jgi:fructokinase
MTAKEQPHLRLGIDLGGTKIAGVVLSASGDVLADLRRPAPRNDYEASIGAIAEAVAELELQAQGTATVGIGMPGSISPASGRVQNANSTWLNGRRFGDDLAARLGRPVRLANDANCFTLSEAVDGAGAGAPSVFGVIMGTGCGGGLVHHGRLIDGPRAIGGEWGHNPLPWAQADEVPGRPCFCGHSGCLETWIAGPAMTADHLAYTGQQLTAFEIRDRARAGDAGAQATLARHASRVARGLAHVVNIFDPHVIVLGGGLSQIASLYVEVPPLMAPFILAEDTRVDLRPPRWGDASGVRGAAWLWNA